jgi:hypothetical protein
MYLHDKYAFLLSAVQLSSKPILPVASYSHAEEYKLQALGLRASEVIGLSCLLEIPSVISIHGSNKTKSVNAISSNPYSTKTLRNKTLPLMDCFNKYTVLVVLGYRSGGPSSIPGTTRKKK